MSVAKIDVEIKLDPNLMCLLERLTNILEQFWVIQGVKAYKEK
jgi:hypothetical protein